MRLVGDDGRRNARIQLMHGVAKLQEENDAENDVQEAADGRRPTETARFLPRLRHDCD